MEGDNKFAQMRAFRLKVLANTYGHAYLATCLPACLPGSDVCLSMRVFPARTPSLTISTRLTAGVTA